MAKSTAFANQLLDLIFRSTPLPAIASIYFSLHTAALGMGDTQDVNEAAYLGYARVSLPRNAGAFNLLDNRVTLAATLSFPESMGAGPNLTHFAMGVALSGPTMVLYSGVLDEAIPVLIGTMPRLNSLTFVDES